MVLLVAYDTACLTVGGCSVWSWIRTIIYVFVPVIVLLLMLLGTVFKPTLNPKSTEQKTMFES